MSYLSCVCFYFCTNIIMPGKTPTTPPDAKRTRPRTPNAPRRRRRRSRTPTRRNRSRSPRRKTPRTLTFEGGKKSRKRRQYRKKRQSRKKRKR